MPGGRVMHIDVGARGARGAAAPPNFGQNSMKIREKIYKIRAQYEHRLILLIYKAYKT